MKLKNMEKTHYRVFLVDPVAKTVSPRFLDRKKGDFGLDVQKMLSAGQVGHVFLCVTEDDKRLHVAADAEAPKNQPGFTFQFSVEEATSGAGVLFGSGPNGGLTPCPVDQAWIESFIIWTDAAETDGPDDE